jgi:hypothetical protein
MGKMNAQDSKDAYFGAIIFYIIMTLFISLNLLILETPATKPLNLVFFFISLSTAGYLYKKAHPTQNTH